MKAVATKVYRSIWAYPVLIIWRDISSILLPKVSTSCLGFSMSFIFLKDLTSAQTTEELTCCWFWIMVQKTSGMEESYLRYFSIVSQSSSGMDASTYFPLQARLSQSNLHIGRQFNFPHPTPVVVRVWTHLDNLTSSYYSQSSRK